MVYQGILNCYYFRHFMPTCSEKGSSIIRFFSICKHHNFSECRAAAVQTREFRTN